MSDAVENTEENEESMEDILHSIRDIIADSNDDDTEAEDTEDKTEAVNDTEPTQEADTDPAEDNTAEGNTPAATEDPVIDDTPNEDNAVQEAPQDTPTMDDDDDILELTEIVDNEDTAIEDNATPGDATEDLMADIDEAIEEDDALKDVLEDAKPDEHALEIEDDTSDDITPEPPTEDIPPQSDLAEPSMKENPPTAEPKAEAKLDDDKLISDNVANEAGSSIQNLIHTLPKNEIDSPHTRQGTSLEDMVIEAIRPMLSDWLDTNLPVLVERIVKQEIQKLIKEKIDS